MTDSDRSHLVGVTIQDHSDSGNTKGKLRHGFQTNMV